MPFVPWWTTTTSSKLSSLATAIRCVSCGSPVAFAHGNTALLATQMSTLPPLNLYPPPVPRTLSPTHLPTTVTVLQAYLAHLASKDNDTILQVWFAVEAATFLHSLMR
jgi:hypothetical protein